MRTEATAKVDIIEVRVMPKRINQKVITARLLLANKLEVKLAKMWDDADKYCRVYGYRLRPCADEAGWFEVIDGNNTPLMITTPVASMYPAKARQMAEDALSLVKDIPEVTVDYAMYRLYTLHHLEQQQANIKQTVKLEKELAKLCDAKTALAQELEALQKRIDAKRHDITALAVAEYS